MPGLIIAFEGAKGAGKTSLIGLVKDELTFLLEKAWSKRPVVVVKQPTQTYPGGKREPDEKATNVSLTEWLTKDRRIAWNQALAACLNDNAVVLMDRHYLSTVVRQGWCLTGGYRRAQSILARQAQLFGSPDLWVIVRAPVGEICERLAARKEEGQSALRKSVKHRLDGYAKMAKYLKTTAIEVDNKDGNLADNARVLAGEISRALPFLAGVRF